MQSPTLLVLAAGIGSRYGGLKQIDPVGPHGEKIIDYCIFDAIRAGFGKVVFVIRREIEADFKKAIGDQYEGRIEVVYAFQELDDLPAPFQVPTGRTKPWGTGHAVLAARHLINEPFGVVNADDFYGVEGFRQLHNFLTYIVSNENYALISFALRNTLSEHGSVARGICRCADDGTLTGVTEHLKIEKREPGAYDTHTDTTFTGDENVSMNMWGFSPNFFGILEKQLSEFLASSIEIPKSEYLLPEVIDHQIRIGAIQVQVLKTPDLWFGVTYTEDKPMVIERISGLIKQGKYPEQLWKNA